MESFGHRILTVILIILVSGSGCIREDVIKPLPEVTIAATPADGNTTDIFEIKILPVGASNSDIPYFYRWDWNNDGIWDSRFSSESLLKHRFYEPGNHVIRVEMIDGKKQTKSFDFSLMVAQGYSPPVARFSVTPNVGNPTTEFIFDASGTRDDEDSLSQLQFRWDPIGDGHWLMQYSSKMVTRYKYSHTGNYTPKLQVKDPTGRTSLVSGEITVNLIDTLIHAEFVVISDTIEVNRTIILDGSPSKYLSDTLQPLLFSWLLPESTEWTVPVKESRLSHVFRQKGLEKIDLKVINPTTGFYNGMTKEILVVDENLPLVARFRLGCPYGNIQTQFFFDAWTSSDDRQQPSDLEIRWDFDGDGTWDTPYIKEKTVYHNYALSGEYFAAMEVKDNADQKSIAKQRIVVSGNSNPTSFFQDQRDGQYYGTVTIGNQVWMSENLNFSIPKKQIGVKTFNQWNCLFEQSGNCDAYGKLYYVSGAIANRLDNEFARICPTGWRLPSKQDWETLLNSIGGEQNGKELRFGGKYDFNALDIGYGTYEFVWEQGNPFPKDTLYHFKETYQESWFFSTTEAVDPQNLRVDVWMMHLEKASLSTWTGYFMPMVYVPARCLKDK